MTATSFNPKRLALPQAIESLCPPGTQWTLEDGLDITTLKWADQAAPHPSNADIETEAERIITLPELGTVPQIISDRQFFQQLAVQGVITPDDALAAVKTGTLPPALVQLVAALPPERQFGANMLLCGATSFERSHPMVPVLGQAFGWDAAQLDALWTAASAL